MWIVLGGQIQATEYYVHGSQGQDTSSCLSTPGAGSAACRTIQYVVSGVALRGGDVVRVAPGTYRGKISVDTGDAGSSGNPVVFRVDGGPVVLEATDSTPLDDATAQQCTAALSCAGDGVAYPMVWRFNIGSRPAVGVIETVWTPVRVDDSPVTGAVFDLTKPIPSKGVLSLADVQQISGSWYRSGNYLYVHTYRDVAPSTTANNVEVIAEDTIVQVKASNVTFDGFTLRYAASQAFHASGSSNVTIRNATIYSNGGFGILYNGGATMGTIENIDVSHSYNRKDFTTSNRSGTCYTATCGWHNNAGGTGLKIDGKPNGATGYLVKHVTAYNSWNVVSIEEISNSRISDVFVKNSPNHTLIISGNATATKCYGLTIDRTLAFNGQDGFYIAGCQNGKALRNGFAFFFGEANEFTASTQGWRMRGNLSSGGVHLAGTDGTPGFSSDRNWMNAVGIVCKISDNRYGCNTTEWRGLGYDANSKFTAVKLAGFATWPPAQGLALSLKNREDFYPLAGSATIDAGDPDLDGDGVLENGPGGDDECTAAHHCSGAGPDIGPFEFGLSTPPPPGEAPDPPGNVQRSDTR